MPEVGVTRPGPVTPAGVAAAGTAFGADRTGLEAAGGVLRFLKRTPNQRGPPARRRARDRLPLPPRRWPSPAEAVSSSGRPMRAQSPTTSFLTAANLIYAIGAGITAAAGTRLALQWILAQGFRVNSFRLRGLGRVPHRYLSSLPPRAGSG